MKNLSKTSKTYEIVKVRNGKLDFTSFRFWINIPSISVNNFLWVKNNYTPRVFVKSTYSKNHIFVKFTSYEKEIQATYTEINSSVHKDSCVEFFLNLFPQEGNAYINFEINAIGTIYVAFGDNTNRKELDIKEIKKIQIVSTLKNPNLGIIEDDFWEIYLKIPISLIEKLYVKKFKFDFATANFYKCGDDTKFEHYGMWNKIEYPKPNFHLPEFFGNLVFL